MRAGKIRVLDKLTANQIAAGEVIEAPSSVVKELVENSIDAGSRQIAIKVEKGGVSLMVVQDNGQGMTKADLSLALERHATSKITNSADLHSLQSLGFRGEALPSIASVARLVIESKTEQDLVGWQLIAEDGKVKALVEKGCNTGTTVVVRDLFYNTPARKKYLKSPLTEMAQITDVVSKLALAHPQIAFSLTGNGRQVLKTPGTGKLEDVISSLWGVEMNNNLFYFSHTTGKIKLSGYLGKINYHRPNRKGQLFFVNGRFVKSQVLTQGLEEGYKTTLPVNRFPFAILNIEMAPEEIDVNVHPTKLEIKFLEPQAVKELLKEVVRKNLQLFMSNHESQIRVNFGQQKSASSSIPSPIKTAAEQLAFTGYQTLDLQPAPVLEEKAVDDFGLNKAAAGESATHVQELSQPQPAWEQDNYVNREEGAKSFFGQLQLIGQIKNNSYLVCEGVDGLYLIDQHAAHERIRYHKLCSAQKGVIPTQQLLFPLSVDLTPGEVELVIEHILNFRDYGFILEHFGGTSFVIREVPQDLPPGEEKNCFYELLALFTDNQNNPSLAFREKALTLLACKTAIKAGQHLSSVEQKYLLEELSQLEDYFTCPHGRPTVISFDYELIAGKFLRK